MDGKYFEVSDGSLIYYRLLGQGSPLVMLHGNGGSSQYFKHQMATLSRTHQLILIDSRGHGKSTNTQATLSFERMAQDLKELLDALGIRWAHFLGFSDGANYALVFCKHYPSYVRSMILNAGNLTFKGMTLWGQWSVYLQYWALSALAPLSKLARRYQQITTLMLGDLGVTDQDLQAIDCPVLLLIGEFDVVRVRHALDMSQSIRWCHLRIIYGQGHLFAQVWPDKFNQIVEDFLFRLHERGVLKSYGEGVQTV